MGISPLCPWPRSHAGNLQDAPHGLQVPWQALQAKLGCDHRPFAWGPWSGESLGLQAVELGLVDRAGIQQLLGLGNLLSRASGGVTGGWRRFGRSLRPTPPAPTSQR